MMKPPVFLRAAAMALFLCLAGVQAQGNFRLNEQRPNKNENSIEGLVARNYVAAGTKPYARLVNLQGEQGIATDSGTLKLHVAFWWFSYCTTP